MADTDAIGRSLDAADAARLRPLVATDVQTGPTSPTFDEEKEPFLDVRKLRTMFIDYLTSKTDEIEEQKEARHYYHGAHWTPDQIRVLRRRHQPPITWNRTARKINSIIGVVERLRSDPVALPTHVKSEKGADLATQHADLVRSPVRAVIVVTSFLLLFNFVCFTCDIVYKLRPQLPNIEKRLFVLIVLDRGSRDFWFWRPDQRRKARRVHRLSLSKPAVRHASRWPSRLPSR